MRSLQTILTKQRRSQDTGLTASGKLLGKEEQTEDEKKPLSEMNDQMRQRLFELFRSKYEVQEAENKNAESDTGYIFTT